MRKKSVKVNKVQIVKQETCLWIVLQGQVQLWATKNVMLQTSSFSSESEESDSMSDWISLVVTQTGMQGVKREKDFLLNMIQFQSEKWKINEILLAYVKMLWTLKSVSTLLNKITSICNRKQKKRLYSAEQKGEAETRICVIQWRWNKALLWNSIAARNCTETTDM
jgi:hypothetical protein